MTRLLTPKLGAYGGLAVAGLLAAVLSGWTEAAILALPFALVAVLGLALAAEPIFEVELALDRDRVLEGEPAALLVKLTARNRIPQLEISPAAPDGSARPGRAQLIDDLAAGEEREVEVPADTVHWGAADIGSVVLRSRDRFGFFLFRRTVRRFLPLRVYPRPELLRSLLAPVETQSLSGNSVSPERGDGIEFAEVRQFHPGDRVRHVNWRVSARRGELHVNQHHPERNTDVVVFIDTFDAVGNRSDTTLDLAVRGAASLAHRYLRTRDRVGMIGFGGILRWVRPGLGTVQLYRLIDSLLDTRVVSSYAWKGIDVIPAGTLPAKALLLALTPLLDRRTVGALLDARGRGFDVAVLELDPSAYISPRPDTNGRLAHRLWTLQREALRERFRGAGIPVVSWSPTRSLELALEEVRGSRRPSGRVRA